MGASSSNDHGEKDLYTAPTEWETFDEKIVEVCPGARRNVARWVPKDKPYKGVVAISHGLHEHCLRYFKVADALTKKGFVVVSLDHVGHGYSDGAKGRIDDWKILPRDFSAVAKSAHEEFPSLPFFILAHSMGTLVAAAAMKNLPFVKVRLNCISHSFSRDIIFSYVGLYL
jgi:alpha-beta hydrolase superfamily lysophospholipase